MLALSHLQTFGKSNIAILYSQCWLALCSPNRGNEFKAAICLNYLQHLRYQQRYHVANLLLAEQISIRDRHWPALKIVQVKLKRAKLVDDTGRCGEAALPAVLLLDEAACAGTGLCHIDTHILAHFHAWIWIWCLLDLCLKWCPANKESAWTNPRGASNAWHTLESIILYLSQKKLAEQQKGLAKRPNMANAKCLSPRAFTPFGSQWV